MLAARDGRLDELRSLVEQRRGNADWVVDVALCISAAKGHLPSLRYLVEERHLPLEPSVKIALQCAASAGELEGVKYLLSIPGSEAPCRKDWGNLALREAARNGRIGVIRFLMEVHEADPLTDDDDVILEAALGGHVDTLRYLLEAKFQHEHWRGQSPAMIYVAWKRLTLAAESYLGAHASQRYRSFHEIAFQCAIKAFESALAETARPIKISSTAKTTPL